MGALLIRIPAVEATPVSETAAEEISDDRMTVLLTLPADLEIPEIRETRETRGILILTETGIPAVEILVEVTPVSEIAAAETSDVRMTEAARVTALETPAAPADSEIQEILETLAVP